MEIEKLELHSQLQAALDKLEHYKETNDNLLLNIMKQDISKGLIEKDNCYLKKCIERLNTQIKELMSEKYPNYNLQKQKIMK